MHNMLLILESSFGYVSYELVDKKIPYFFWEETKGTTSCYDKVRVSTITTQDARLDRIRIESLRS